MASSVRMDVKEVLQHFQELEDPRSSVNLLHPLDSVVVIAIMAAFAIPEASQRRVLFWGVTGAIVMRAAFILGGAEKSGARSNPLQHHHGNLPEIAVVHQVLQRLRSFARPRRSAST